jgi:hypothetical protein
MFQKANIDALFDELDTEWRGKPEFDKLSREAHLGIALFDAAASSKILIRGQCL